MKNSIDANQKWQKTFNLIQKWYMIVCETRIWYHQARMSRCTQNTQKIRFYLYEVHFNFEINAEMLIVQFNRFKIDLSNVFIIKWIAWIWLFDFKVKHIQEKKHTTIDELFKRSVIDEKIKQQTNEFDIDDWIDVDLNFIRTYSILMKIKPVLIKNENYNQKSKKITAYLFYMKKSFIMIIKKFNSFKQKTLRYKMQNDHFFQKNSKNVFMRKIIDFMKDRFWIIQHLHDKFDHKKKEETYCQIINQYW